MAASPTKPPGKCVSNIERKLFQGMNELVCQLINTYLILHKHCLYLYVCIFLYQFDIINFKDKIIFEGCKGNTLVNNSAYEAPHGFIV